LYLQIYDHVSAVFIFLAEFDYNSKFDASSCTVEGHCNTILAELEVARDFHAIVLKFIKLLK